MCVCVRETDRQTQAVPIVSHSLGCFDWVTVRPSVGGFSVASVWLCCPCVYLPVTGSGTLWGAFRALHRREGPRGKLRACRCARRVSWEK